MVRRVDDDEEEKEEIVKVLDDEEENNENEELKQSNVSDDRSNIFSYSLMLIVDPEQHAEPSLDFKDKTIEEGVYLNEEELGKSQEVSNRSSSHLDRLSMNEKMEEERD